jgi:hypothetical protein
MSKLQQLTDDWGYADTMDMLEHATFDSVAPGICMNPDCDYSTEVEPDQDRGWCEVCETGTVKSCLILAGII